MNSMHYWNQITSQLKKKILFPSYCRSMQADAQKSEMRLVLGKEGRIKDGHYICFYLLVDETDGVIADISYQVFGEPLLIGAAEVLAELTIRKNYIQAKRITTELMDKHIADKKTKIGFPKHGFPFMNLVLSALAGALEKCDDIPFPEDLAVPPNPLQNLKGVEYAYPNFLELSDKEKEGVVSHVITEEIQPFLELDAGGVKIAKIEDYVVTILYEGACTSCYSAIGTTLSSIGQILKAKIHPEIQVVPDSSSLSFTLEPNYTGQ